MKIGCARVSTDDQKMDLQRDALTAAGCERIFTDTASGSKTERPGLAEALSFARRGDALVVWRLDRLGRSLPELVRVVGELEATGVAFESITERIETSTAAGRLVFHVFAALAEFERRLVVERTVAGLSAARAGPGATADSTGHDQHSRPGSQHQPHRESQRGRGFKDHQHGQRCGCVGLGGDVEATGQRGSDGGELGGACDQRAFLLQGVERFF